MSLLNSNINEKVEIFNSIFFNRLSNVRPREAVVWQRSTLLQRKDQKKIFSPGNIEELYLIKLLIIMLTRRDNKETSKKNYTLHLGRNYNFRIAKR